MLQHTDCGITRLAGDPALLTAVFKSRRMELKAKSVSDPRAAVAVDVAALRAVPALPNGWLISGLVYDVATGLVEVVVPPTPIHTPYIPGENGKAEILHPPFRSTTGCEARKIRRALVRVVSARLSTKQGGSYVNAKR